MTIKRTRSARSKAIWWPWRSGPTVYLSRSRGAAGTDSYERTLRHEMVHVRQWLVLGRCRFLLRYLTRRGRLALEAEAFRENLAWYAEHGITRFEAPPVPGATISVFEYHVNVLASRYMLWGVSRTEIRAALMGGHRGTV